MGQETRLGGEAGRIIFHDLPGTNGIMAKQHIQKGKFPFRTAHAGLFFICHLEIRGMGTAGCDPRLMGLGPVYAVPKALENAGLTMDDIQLIELNEAFAAQSLGCIKLLGWEDKMDIINVNGGAIALGHPVGSSGCRIIVSLVHEMKRRGLKYGLATLCIAGGMGQATVLEMCD